MIGQKHVLNMGYRIEKNNLKHSQGVKALVFDINIQRFESFCFNMKYYYKQLINKRKLIKFLLFSNINIIYFFKVNYRYVFNIFKRNILFNFQKFNYLIKRLLPLFSSVIKCFGKFLFIGIKSFYLQELFFLDKINICGKLEDLKIGILTNYLIIDTQDFIDFFQNKTPSLVIILNLKIENLLLFESKKQNIPIIGLIDGINDSSIIEYPIFLNSFYFYNIYILSRFLFKYFIQLL